MKRIFTLCAVLLGGITFAQGPVATKSPKKVDMKKVANDPIRVGHGSGASNRATVFQSDFSTPSDWTMTNASSNNYDWEITSTFPASLVSQNYGPSVNSTSGGNFAIVDSDAQGGSETQDCNLTTATSFDCSSQSTVAVRFENYHRIFYETQTVMVSTDGVNFEGITVNNTYGAGVGNYVASPNVEEITVNVTTVGSTTTAGSSTVWLRFNYQGAWDWFWVIDDVYVEDAPMDELAGSLFTMCDDTPSYALGERIEHTRVPANQAGAIKFMGNLTNQGANNNTNARVDITVANSVPTTVYNNNTTMATLTPSTMRIDSITWTGTTTIEDYTVDFLANFDNYSTDPNQSNNDGAAAFSIVPTTGASSKYGRDDNTFKTAGLWNGAGEAYIMGVEYSLHTNGTAYGIDVALTASTDPGASICAILYELDPNASSFNNLFVAVQDNCLDGVEHTLVANDINGSTGPIKWLTLDFPAPVALTAGKGYVAALNHYGGTEEVVLMNGGTTTRGAATVFIYDPGATSGGPWFYLTSKPMIRLNMGTLDVNETEKLNLTMFQNQPNPFNGTSTITYSLEENANVTFDVVDITGKLVYTQNLGNTSAGQHSLTLQSADFTPGVYFYTMTAGKEKVTLKMIITE